MSFHVEASRSFHRAWLFNLSESELQPILERWTRGEILEISERQWDPADSSLTVLEGRALDAPELALGQGWSNATRVSRDVSADVLGARSPSSPNGVCVLADNPAATAAVESVLADFVAQRVQWSAVRHGILRARPPADELAAVVVVLSEPTAEHAFEVGLAVGALGDRVILTRVAGVAQPAAFANAIEIDPARPQWRGALAQRLRLAGCTARPPPEPNARGRPDAA